MQFSADDKFCGSEILADAWKKTCVRCYRPIVGKGDWHIFDLSLIVPLYNAEKFINTLIPSLLSQKTAYSFQIIFINDSSSDRTKESIDEYLVKTKHHVEYVEIRHGGLSRARNAGLKIAKGSYIGFIDADDYIDEYYVEKLLNAAYENDADIVKCGTVNMKNGRCFSKDCHDDVIIDGKMEEKIMDYNSYAWGGVFRRELLDGVKFPESYWCEDMIVRFLLYRRAGKFVNLAEPLYCRVLHPNQMTKTVLVERNAKCLEQLYLIEQLVELNEEYHLDNDVWLYMNVLHECSEIMVKRITKMDEVVKKQVFARARILLKGLYQEEYKKELKGKWRILSDVLLKGRYDLWKMERWL